MDPKLYAVAGCYGNAIDDLHYFIVHIGILEWGWKIRVAPMLVIDETRVFDITVSSPKELRDKLMVLL